MMASKITTMRTLLFFLLITTVALASTYRHSGGCSSSCGPLQIIYPFRLRDDPSECGERNKELSCEGNNTMLNLPNSSYYVTNVSYKNDQFISSATLVDSNVAHSNCSLPTMPFAMESFGNRYGPKLNFYKWIIFMNCSERIFDKRYMLIQCLSRHESSSFIYAMVVYAVGRIRSLQSKCYFLVKIPTNSYLDAPADIIQLLHQGFSVYWQEYPSVSFTKKIHECIHKAAKDTFYEKDFVGILYIISSPLIFEQSYLQCLFAPRDTYTPAFWTLHIVFFFLIYAALLMLVCRYVLAPLCLLVFLAYKISKLFTSIDMVERFLKNQEALSPQRYTYNEIISMTSNFTEKIGQGGFGSVFKGKLPGGYLIAVKMMGTTMGDGEDFINEVSTIGQIHHINVVQLVGFCVEGSHIRALVYEYMANGSLDKCIFVTSRSNRFLTMEKLYEIALSVARGLHYLHQGCNMRILHFDIKPHNILLDHNFTPKISDFGLAKLHSKEYSLVFMSALRGTIGYIAPELVSRSFGAVSHKSDVYSFGMLLMDIAGRRRHVDMNMENSSQVYYPSWIYDKLQKIEELQQREEIEINENIEIGNLERKLCMVGLWCIQTRPSDRPSMNKVVEMLETADIDSLQMPPKPFFSTSNDIPSSNLCMNSSELSIIVSDK